MTSSELNILIFFSPFVLGFFVYNRISEKNIKAYNFMCENNGACFKCKRKEAMEILRKKYYDHGNKKSVLSPNSDGSYEWREVRYGYGESSKIVGYRCIFCDFKINGA